MYAVEYLTGFSLAKRKSSWKPCSKNFALNTLRPRQNGRHFPDDIFKCIFLNENAWIAIKISLKFVLKGSINNNPALVQIMAWRWPGDKPLSEPMMVSLLTHICVTRPQWVNLMKPGDAYIDHIKYWNNHSPLDLYVTFYEIWQDLAIRHVTTQWKVRDWFWYESYSCNIPGEASLHVYPLKLVKLVSLF